MLSASMMADVFPYGSVYVKEAASEYKVKVISAGALGDLGRLRKEMRDAPGRDLVVAYFEYGSDSDAPPSAGLSSGDDVWRQVKAALFESLEYAGSFDVELVVQKGVGADGLYSIYDADFFAEWIVGWSAEGLLGTLNKCVMGSGNVPLRVEFLNDEGMSLRFEGLGNPAERELIVEKRKEVASIDGFERLALAPQDLRIADCEGVDGGLVAMVDSICSMLALAHVANRTSFHGDSVSFAMRGGSEVCGTLSACDAALGGRGIYELYRWAYSGGEVFDKVEVARNILCMGGSDGGILPVSGTALSTIKNNYRVFLRKGVKDYLDARGSLSDSVTEYCDRVAQCLVEFVGDFKKNLAAILGYIAALLLTGQVDMASPDCFTGRVAQISAAVISVSCLLGVASFVICWRRAAYYEGMIESMRKSFEDVFSDDELRVLVMEHPQRKRARRHLHICSTVLLVLWVLMCVCLFGFLDWLSGNEPLLFGIDCFGR